MLATVLEELLDTMGASRVTLRRGEDDGYAFPVSDEALAPGVASLRRERTVDLTSQPVAVEVRSGRQVVQDDCRSAFADASFQRMLETYGGLAAQIVTPVVAAGRVVAILSLHQLGSPRRWTPEEAAACRRAAERLAELL